MPAPPAAPALAAAVRAKAREHTVTTLAKAG
jgi:hypothetical protein